MRYDADRLDYLARELFKEERAIKRLDGWFLLRESILDYKNKHRDEPTELRSANALYYAVSKLPLYVSDNNIFVGTERDAFAQSYALINPNFRVSTFNGYCDPSAVFNDIEPNDEFSRERIEKVRKLNDETEYVKLLRKVYEDCEIDTREVVYFIEQVTGHVIPDIRPILAKGILAIQDELKIKIFNESDEEKRINYLAMDRALSVALLLADRYREIVISKMDAADLKRKAELKRMAKALENVPRYGASNLFEAIQSFLLVWQTMCLEQAPNPFAFSLGNVDRIFEPYRQKENLTRKEAAGLFKHFLLFYNVGSRSWAISQNIIVGGKDLSGEDLTNPTTYALLDAYYEMNLPQPILSVKLHKNTPDILYEELGRFFFTPGELTPSLFNDETLFPILLNRGVDEDDIPDYSIAGCQEPLIMGKDNGNTTNSWFSLPKVLELVLNDGVSLITNKQIDAQPSKVDILTGLKNIRERFYQKADYYIDRMVEAANGTSKAISFNRVPFLSSLMGGIETGYDTRDIVHQGTKYNGSGCLIHGLSVLADSFVAIDDLVDKRPDLVDDLLPALRNNFEGYDEIHKFLLDAPKYGNNIVRVDNEAKEIAQRISKMVASKKNYLGNSFRPDWSSPTTHLLYGYWVGATPDGRRAREQLNYGVDPLFGCAENGLGSRMLSFFNLNFLDFSGGYASHLGIDPKYFKGQTYEEKGLQFKKRVIEPLFFSGEDENNPFYLYVNVTSPEILRKVLTDPKKYAPSGVYIMRIHGTFVNFLDLSPDVQEDIIKRLDLPSTTIGC